MKIAFITGITGQTGSYLAEELLENDYIVYGMVRRNSVLFTFDRIEHLRDNPKLRLKYGDLTDASSINRVINEIVSNHLGFDRFEIYNLGAQSHVQVSFDMPVYTSMVDGIGTLNILETIRNLSKSQRDRIRFYQAGTSEMFGRVGHRELQNEDTEFKPVSPYACAKVYAYHITKNYRESYGLHCSASILFNHESSRRGKNFVTMKVVDGVKKIERGELDCLKLGNLDSKRDWGHAKEYAHGIYLIMQHDEPDDYVLATGRTTSVREFVEKCFMKIGVKIEWSGKGENEVGIDIATGRILVSVDPKFYRPCEVDFLLGDSSKAQRVLGWEAKMNLEDIIDEMFENSD